MSCIPFSYAAIFSSFNTVLQSKVRIFCQKFELIGTPRIEKRK